MKEIPQVIKEIEKRVDLFRINPWAIPSVKYIREIEETLKLSGCKDSLLLFKVQNLVTCGAALEKFLTPATLLNLYLNGFGPKSIEHTRSVHALAYTSCELEKNVWAQSKLMLMYARLGEQAAVEKIFAQSRKQSIVLYNALMFSYGSNAIEKAEGLYEEITTRSVFLPTTVTFRAYLPALSKLLSPEKAVKVVQSMKRYKVEPDYYHYGCVVDAFARRNSVDDISKAVEILKYVPLARHQWAFNAVLSRCFPREQPITKEAKEKREAVLTLAQDLVDFLDSERYTYEVQERTYLGLKRIGMSWPRSVKIIKE